MYTEIIKIIEGGLNKDVKKVKSYAELLASKLDTPEEQRFKNRIMQVISGEVGTNFTTLNGATIQPKETDSNLTTAEIVLPAEIDHSLILPREVNKAIMRFIMAIDKKDILEANGISSKLSLLLHGPPGCGKTTIAKMIAKEADLPLIIVRFDALISSLLGSTAKNLRKVFEYADSFPCILFIDEFDAIGKDRNDHHELGELKRVINSLLQNIDRFIETNVFIAATNHSDILDKAVWRRFNDIVEVSKPSDKNDISELLTLFLGKDGNEIISDKRKKETLIDLFLPYSPSDIETICLNAKRNSLIEDNINTLYAFLIEQLYQFKFQHNTNSVEFAQFLYKNSISQAEIALMLDISLRQVKKILKPK